MAIRLVICLLLVAYSHAEATDDSFDDDSNETPTAPSNISLSSPIFNVDDEIYKIAKSCLSSRDHEKLTGYLIREYHARTFISEPLMKLAQKIIGMIEMRAVLGLTRPRSWIKYKYSDTSANESNASTAQEYFDSRESRYIYDILGKSRFFKNIVPPAITFLDKRHPAIRKMFRHEFEKIFQIDAEGRMDRKVIDHLFDKHANIVKRVDGAIDDIFWNFECNEKRYDAKHSRRKFE